MPGSAALRVASAGRRWEDCLTDTRWRPLRQTEKSGKLGIGLDIFGFFKLDDEAPISIPTVAGESYVGFETDIVAEWQITSDFAIDARYGLFVPGDAFPTSKVLHFFYWGVSYGF